MDPHHRLCVRMEGTGLYKNISCVLFCCVTLYQRKKNPENFAFFCLHCSFPLLDVKVQINTE